MNLHIFREDDVQHALTTALARKKQMAEKARGARAAGPAGVVAFNDGYEAALAVVAEALGLSVQDTDGHPITSGIVIPYGRLSPSYRAGLSLEQFLRERDAQDQPRGAT